ncbi:MAG: bifunctional riboflavin kinase/FMN adenylyltransferase [Puniceicoccales bacterium]|nr:bifunctional riboflavin kinase/FMN adenylyltransferase [Puniceicoccales bacterium]
MNTMNTMMEPMKAMMEPMKTMKIFNSLASLTPATTPVRLAIGIFDGVHLGHREVIGGAVRAAHGGGGGGGGSGGSGGGGGGGGVAVALTFAPHPSRVFRPDNPVPQIFDDAEKARRIAALGADCFVREPFTRQFAALDANDFLTILKNTMPGLAGIHVGDNFRFGRERGDDVESLREKAAAFGAEVVAVPEVSGDGARVSSTRIRALLAHGEMAAANALLGEPYAISGTVTTGRALGRTIGFPTLNVPWAPELLPKFGVYAVRVRRETDGSGNGGGGGGSGGGGGGGGGGGNGDALAFAGIANYGLRPTVEGGVVCPQLEVHLFAAAAAVLRAGFVTGVRLRVECLRFVRPEKKFPTLDALRAQIATDIAALHLAQT